MIDLYTWPTPNGHKIHIMLEETGLKYNVIPIDIGAGDQFKPDFLKISPNNKMPAMVDHEGPGGKPMALAESGAMLFYATSGRCSARRTTSSATPRRRSSTR
jgi:GST-like protein